MNVTIFRHGQSTANAGEPSDDPASIELTPLGWEQARMIAEAPTGAPGLIVTSPFLRTKQTARPTVERFPSVAQEEWPIQEFTYLPAEPFKGTTRADRVEFAAAFWDRSDPFYREGPGAESLNDLFVRVYDMFDRLDRIGSATNEIAIFGHGMFMRAILWGVLTNIWTMTPDTMQGFRSFCLSFPIPNAVSLPLSGQDGRWHVGTLGINHIPEGMVTT